jgi:hypothetical protein
LVSANHDGSGESLGAFLRLIGVVCRHIEMGKEGEDFSFCLCPADCCNCLLEVEGLALPLLPVGAQEQKPCIFMGIGNYNADGVSRKFGELNFPVCP